MIDIRKLKELVRLMVAADLTELDLRDEQEQVTIRRHGSGAPQVVHAPVAAMAPVAAAAPASLAAAAPAPAPAAPAADDRVRIESPMVGTFYTASAPEKPPFVKVGDRIGPDSVVCIVEAMKVFNEIKAEVSGVVDEVLVRNGTPVEFGQPLFLLRPGT